ncbi:hypothetical protein SteCoe_35056 [Stentor coeruleus]|uniref:Uncharacterized protein n=1 Tax=Stentor coeruleus TaxID=5963 RepID=A0A1R2AT56_9CILI|nr:hypothetical protein SteCoe_35056 [Stentor coeruleus]
MFQNHILPTIESFQFLELQKACSQSFNWLLKPVKSAQSTKILSKNSTKRGRKITKSTEILSQFLDNSLNKAPRKEYVRCCLLRRLVKMIRLVLNNKIKLALHSSTIEILNFIESNKEELKHIINKENLPFEENKVNVKFKSYSDGYCRQFFSNTVAREIYKLYIEYLFSGQTLEQRSKDLGLYCCRKGTEENAECKEKWEKLKEILLGESEVCYEESFEKKIYCNE